ncbi:MAG: hypothetical protein WBI20_04355 [Burkholderiaceae bacterium]
MNKFAWIPLVAALLAATSYAQERIYRCGNQYTNTLPEAGAQGCKLVEGANVSVIKGTRATPVVPLASGGAAASGLKPDAAAQKARDSDARLILESELSRAQSRQLELLKDYNNGEPEKMGSEGRNHQKYLDRVAGMLANLERNQNDIAAIQRELTRLSASK